MAGAERSIKQTAWSILQWSPDEECGFALPALPKGYGWYVRATTDRGILDYPELLKDQRKAELKERSIVVFTADRIVEVETKKNESITTLTDDQSS